jgi:hypothetical protein
MIDDPAQSTGLVVKVDDQRHELCFGNRIYKIHTLRSYVWFNADVCPEARTKGARESKSRDPLGGFTYFSCTGHPGKFSAHHSRAVASLAASASCLVAKVRRESIADIVRVVRISPPWITVSSKAGAHSPSGVRWHLYTILMCLTRHIVRGACYSGNTPAFFVFINIVPRKTGLALLVRPVSSLLVLGSAQQFAPEAQSCLCSRYGEP